MKTSSDLDSSGVADEGGRHFESARGDVAQGGLDVVGQPLDEVRAILVLHVQHLVVHLLGRDLASEHRGYCQIPVSEGVKQWWRIELKGN